MPRSSCSAAGERHGPSDRGPEWALTGHQAKDCRSIHAGPSCVLGGDMTEAVQFSAMNCNCSLLGILQQLVTFRITLCNQ